MKVSLGFFLSLFSTLLFSLLHHLYPEVYLFDLFASIFFVATFITGFFFFLEMMDPSAGTMMTDEEKQKEGTKKRKVKASINRTGTPRKKKGVFGDLFKKKKRCDECGRELVYRKEFESYYCPECHTYK